MNVLLYVFDALRADHVSTYGYERNTTPNLDSLADDGIVFEQCFSPTTWTRAVAVSLLTGVSPLVHGTKHIDSGYNPPLPPLSEQFQQAGYQTIGVGSMPNLRGEWGFNRGFDTYRDMYNDEQVLERREQMESHNPDSGDEIAMTRAEDVNRGFIEWYESEYEEGGFFSMLWSNETHAPYNPPEGFETYTDPDYEGPVDGSPDSHKVISNDADVQHLINLYDSEIRYADSCFSDLCDFLSQKNELQNTLILAVADHGDAFGEHGQFGHGIAPHDTVTHVPLIIRPPNPEVNNHRVGELMSLLDIYPTLLEYIDGLSLYPNLDSFLQGNSFKEALKGASIEGHDYVFQNVQLEEVKEEYNSVRSPEWRYMEVEQDKDIGWGLSAAKLAVQRGVILDIVKNPKYYLERHLHSDDNLLFNIGNDPGEQENVISNSPKVAKKLSDRLETWVSEREQLRNELDATESTITIEGEAKERLEELGYLQG